MMKNLRSKRHAQRSELHTNIFVFFIVILFTFQLTLLTFLIYLMEIWVSTWVVRATEKNVAGQENGRPDQDKKLQLTSNDSENMWVLCVVFWLLVVHVRIQKADVISCNRKKGQQSRYTTPPYISIVSRCSTIISRSCFRPGDEDSRSDSIRPSQIA